MSLYYGCQVWSLEWSKKPPNNSNTHTSFSVYVALTYIPGGGLLTGFAMRSDPNVAFG